jgi:hypothetical protein
MTTRPRASLVLGVGCWLAYLSILAPVVTYAAVRFAALYPAVGQSGIAPAVCLGIVAAAFGVWQRSVPVGLLALALGAATTIAGLSVPPLVRFPEDQYPPAALWVIADSLPLVVGFVVATLGAGSLQQAGTCRR